MKDDDDDADEDDGDDGDDGDGGDGDDDGDDYDDYDDWRLAGPFFPLARNSHAQSISSASCHSKRRLAIPNGARASRVSIQLLKPNADPVVLT